MVEITINYVLCPEGDLTPRGRFQWLRFKQEFKKRKCRRYC